MSKLIASLKKNKKGILLMIISSVFGCLGQLFWKLASTKGFLFIIIGLFFYCIGAVFMLNSYKHGKLSVLQPMLSMSYVLSIFLAAIFLKGEPITIAKIIGVLLIIAGVVFIGGSEEDE